MVSHMGPCEPPSLAPWFPAYRISTTKAHLASGGFSVGYELGQEFRTLPAVWVQLSDLYNPDEEKDLWGHGVSHVETLRSLLLIPTSSSSLLALYILFSPRSLNLV